MPHPVGERLRCEDCGAEIVFVKACPCPDTEPKRHAHECCGRAMRAVSEEYDVEPQRREVPRDHTRHP